MNTELEKQIAMLQTSPTLIRLAQLAKGFPCDVHKPEDLHSAFATSSIDLIDALDNNRITFTHDEDKAMFYGLLTVTVDYVMNGRLRNALQVASRH